MKKSGIILILFLNGFMGACTYDIIAPEKIEVPEVVSFSEDIIPIFNESCNISGCHSDGGQSPNLTADDAYTSLTFFGYVDTEFPKESKIYVKITTGTMEQYATDKDREFILAWIEQDALNN